MKIDKNRLALQRERDITLRRLIKLFCYVLNKRYGFGKKRCADVIMDVADLHVKIVQHLLNKESTLSEIPQDPLSRHRRLFHKQY